jgi:arsenate reductase
MGKTGMKYGKPVVLFVCTHNACRSQIAEALGKRLAGDVFDSCSAGTHIKTAIDADAVRLMREKYGIDMITGGQKPKLISKCPKADWVITMGCGVKCPAIPGAYHEDWGLEDPTGKSDADFLAVIKQIEKRIHILKEKIAKEEPKS